MPDPPSLSTQSRRVQACHADEGRHVPNTLDHNECGTALLWANKPACRQTRCPSQTERVHLGSRPCLQSRTRTHHALKPCQRESTRGRNGGAMVEACSAKHRRVKQCCKQNRPSPKQSPHPKTVGLRLSLHTSYRVTEADSAVSLASEKEPGGFINLQRLVPNTRVLSGLL